MSIVFMILQTIIFFLFTVSPVSAQALVPPLSTPELTVDAGTAGYFVVNFGLYFQRIAQLGLGIVGILLLGYLVWGGVNWVLAGEDKGKVENARGMITQAVIGFALFASVFAIAGIVFYFLGIQGGPLTIWGLNQPPTNGGGSGNGGSGGGSQICSVGQTGHDGGNGGYCTTGGRANMRCMTTPNISYPHWEPCTCQTGTKTWNWRECTSW